jgi:plastocyanin
LIARAVHRGYPKARDARSRWTPRTVLAVVIGAFVLVIAGCTQNAAAPTDSETTAPPSSPPIGGATASAAPDATRPQPEFSSSMGSSTSAPAGAVTVEMLGPPPHYMPVGVSAAAADVTFFLTNRSVGVHTFAIGRGPLDFVGEYVRTTPLAASEAVNAGRSVTFTVYMLPAGTYAIWCTIGNHAFEGMKGTLTVTP